MSEKVTVGLELNIEAVRAAAMNADNLQNIAFEVPVVNPKELTIDSKIFGFKVVPVDDQIQPKDMKENDARCISIKEVLVDSLDKNTSPGCITVNGRHDIPVQNGRMVDLPNVWVASRADADAIAFALTEVELQRVDEDIERKMATKVFLEKQLKDNRF